jgi:hypothetical protein
MVPRRAAGSRLLNAPAPRHIGTLYRENRRMDVANEPRLLDQLKPAAMSKSL